MGYGLLRRSTILDKDGSHSIFARVWMGALGSRYSSSGYPGLVWGWYVGGVLKELNSMGATARLACLGLSPIG